MLENGFIKLHRSLLKWEWYDDINVFKLFLHLLLTVSIEDSKWHGEIVKRGSRITSYHMLSKETRLSVRQIRTALDKLRATQSVTIKTTPKYTVVTVNNYDKFQTATQSMTNERQSQIDVNCNQIINGKNNIKKTTHSMTQSEISNFPTDKANIDNDFEIATSNLTLNRHSSDTVATNERQQYKKDKESIRKYKKVGRGSEMLPNSLPLPTLSEIVEFAFENNLKVNPNKFYYYYENTGWKGVNNWKMKLMEWNETERPKQQVEIPVQTTSSDDKYSFDLEEYEKRLMQIPNLE